jgi:hypothetical protein
MYQKLDQIPELLMVDEVLVENQPTLINPTMKSVSAMLFSYFIMRGIHEKERTRSNIKSINFCSPANKITVGGKDVDDKLEEAEDNKVYKLTKTLGVKFCKALIADNDDWMKMIESHKKQDDMADAFLQGIVRTFGSTLPDHYASKIKNIDIGKEEYKVRRKSSSELEEDNTIRIGKKKSDSQDKSTKKSSFRKTRSKKNKQCDDEEKTSVIRKTIK